MSTINPHHLKHPVTAKSIVASLGITARTDDVADDVADNVTDNVANDVTATAPQERATHHRSRQHRKKRTGADFRWLAVPRKHKRPSLFGATKAIVPPTQSDQTIVSPAIGADTTALNLPPEVQSKRLAAIINAKVVAKNKRLQQRTEGKQRSAKHRYNAQTRRPIVSLFFVLPLIIIYEIAKIFTGLPTAASGVDFWVHQALNAFGVGQLVILPMLTTAILLMWHHRRDDHYFFHPKIIPCMMLEAMGLGLMLFVFANMFQLVLTEHPNAGAVADPYHWAIGSSRWWSNVVTFIGTGIHEELIFRVLLLLPLTWLLQPLMSSKKGPLVVAAAISSLLFAVAHLNGFNPNGDSYDGITFGFRLVAAGIFSTLFFYRGFAIVVGTHIAYNVLTLISI